MDVFDKSKTHGCFLSLLLLKTATGAVLRALAKIPPRFQPSLLLCTAVVEQDLDRVLHYTGMFLISKYERISFENNLLTYTYIFLCRVAHKANSFFLHLVRSSAATSASSDDISRSLRSREMVWLQVFRGLPRPLLPGSFQFMACFGSLSAFMRK